VVICLALAVFMGVALSLAACGNTVRAAEQGAQGGDCLRRQTQ